MAIKCHLRTVLLDLGSDNGSERIVEKEKLINIELIQSFEDLRNKNKSLSTAIDGLSQEKKKQDKQLNELQQYLANERITNKQLENRFDKSQQELNKLKYDVSEQRCMNQQLIQKQNDLVDQMKKQEKELNALHDHVNDLIFHLVVRSKFTPPVTRKCLEGAEKLQLEATSGEFATSQIVITYKPKQAHRRK
ncbi:unnamed protein product [Rotaria socialis]|uniref:Uncharacterized protein n=1 Tax=Rotaria socialis TaxID=392032 RepID=A0A821HEU1_9BILA|nr:unnamed protein product [Rotaria socialis]